MQGKLFTQIDVSLAKHRQTVSDMLSGFVSLKDFPVDTIYRSTPMIGHNKEEISRVESWPEDLDAKIMSQPLESLKLRTISFMTGKWFGCIGFTMRDGIESPKYGDKHNYKSVYILREDTSLTGITIHSNNDFIVGLSFTYMNGAVDDLIGAGYEDQKGPLRTVAYPVEDGEAIVGVTID